MTSFHSTEATQVTNITLNVKDLNKMTEFYSTVLGFTIKAQHAQQTILNVGANGHTLTLQELHDGRQPGYREQVYSILLFFYLHVETWQISYITQFN